MGSQYTGGRIFGLDVMRATGGLIVVLAHTSFLVDLHWPRFPIVPAIDWVALFFVLSGFLIGGLLLDQLAKPRIPRLAFADFMQRRWLRTLPNYFLFLLLNIVLVSCGLAPGMVSKATVAYAVFMQNFHLPLDLFFWESWSLAVEEWFYLLFPLIVFGLIAWMAVGGRRAFLVACLLFIGLPVLARFGVAHHVSDRASWDLWVHKLVLTRLDAPGYGMLAAWAARQWPRTWHRLRWPLVPLAILMLWATLRNTYGSSPSFALYALKSVEALGLALFLPLFASWRNGGPLNCTFRRLSLITYAQYLVHMPLLYLMRDWVPHPVAWVCALRYISYLGLVQGLSAAVYYGWELRFMRLRDPLGRWLVQRIGRQAAPI